MYEPSPDARLEVPSYTKEITGWLIRCENTLDVVKRDLDEVNRKIDRVLYGPAVYHALGSHDSLASVGPNHSPTNKGHIAPGGSHSLGAFLLLRCCLHCLIKVVSEL